MPLLSLETPWRWFAVGLAIQAIALVVGVTTGSAVAVMILWFASVVPFGIWVGTMMWQGADEDDALTRQGGKTKARNP